MELRIIVVCLLIAVITVLPFIATEDQSLDRSKRACRYFFGNCQHDPCCEHLFCNSFKFCGWDAAYTIRKG
uniref:Putative salivary toxin-like peptide n=1 Tax=Nyssomyia neivai TaxID=330878 RepID=A0A1L8DP17_9DIPT